MKNLKRVLSLALSTAMVLGMMVMGSSAVSADVKADHNQEAIAIVNVLGIMEGDENGNFNPDKTVSRNEMAVVMANLSNLKLNGAHPFSDVPAWADKYVGALYANGLTSGTSATTYGGAGNVTATQAALMIMKTLGYFEYQGEFGDDWALATIKQATKIELFEDIDAGVNDDLTRNELAQMIYNALYTQTVNVQETTGMTVEGNGITVTQKASYDYSDKGALLLVKLFDEENLNDSSASDPYGRVEITWSYEDDDTDEVESSYVEAPDYVLVVDEADETIEDMIKEEKLTKKIENEEDFTDAETVGTVIELYLDDDDNIIEERTVRYFYVAVEIDKVEECDEDIAADADAMEYGAEYKVTFVEDNAAGLDELYDIQLAGFNAKTYVEGAYVIFPTQDDVTYVPVIDEDAVDVSDKATDDLYVDTTAAKVVSGEVDSYKADYVKVEGEKYLLIASSEDLKSGDEFNFVLDPNGFVLGYEAVEEDATIEDVYVVDTLWDDEETVKGVSKEKFYAQLIDLTGEVVEVELEYDQIDDFAKGDLVTIEDKKTTVAGETYKANNDKFIVYAWADEDYEVADQDDFDEVTDDDGNVKIEKGDKRLASDLKLTADTQYILVSETASDLEVTVKTGGVNVTVVDTDPEEGFENIAWAITEKDEKEVLYVIVVSADDAELDEDTVLSDDMVYVAEADWANGKDDTYEVEVVFANGEVETIVVDDEGWDESTGWFNYAINEDGYYELTEVEADDKLDDVADTWSDDYEGVIVVGSIADKDALDDNDLTVNALKYINVEGAKFVDMNQGDYDTEINTLARVITLLDKDIIENVKVAMYITEDGAQVIILTNADEK